MCFYFFLFRIILFTFITMDCVRLWARARAYRTRNAAHRMVVVWVRAEKLNYGYTSWWCRCISFLVCVFGNWCSNHCACALRKTRSGFNDGSSMVHMQTIHSKCIIFHCCWQWMESEAWGAYSAKTMRYWFTPATLPIVHCKFHMWFIVSKYQPLDYCFASVRTTTSNFVIKS